MVYVARDGTIVQSPPWNIDRVTNLFYAAISFVILFFKSLVGLDSASSPSYGGSRSSGSSFRGSGGGGGGGSGPWRPGGGGPSKRIMTMKDINPPTIGGCPGGACGR